MKIKFLILFIILAVFIVFYSANNKKAGIISVSPSPINSALPEIESGEIYKDEDLGFQIKVPKEFKINQNGDFSKLVLIDKKTVGAGPTNFIYISVVNPEMKNSVGEIYNYNPQDLSKLLGIKNTGENVNLAETLPEQKEWFNYTWISTEKLDRGMAKVFENKKPWEFPAGTTENRFIYDSGKNIYILGYYTGGNSTSENTKIDPGVAKDIVKSFKVIK